MSIIYDALKKAERERQPSVRSVPVHHLTPPSHRGGRWMILTALVMVIAAGGGFASWVWLTSELVAPAASKPDRLGAAEAGDVAVEGADGKSQIRKEPTSAQPPLKSESETGLEPQIAADVAYQEARRAEEEGRWEEAVQRYRQAVALNPSLLAARNDLGHLYVRLNRFGAAIEEFQKVLALAPDYAVARNNLGSAYLLIGQEQLAIQEFLAAVRLDGTYVTPYYNLASVFARRGDAGQAMTFLAKALTLEPAVLSWVREDPDFAGVWDSPEFRQLRSLRAAR
ncbi:MAG TPA: tetratricopeptide repeat protein [Alphaproteobacteria bacterium]|nr:tetratricopeptide repeat protein [Alphaproteobacteria bacterium]